MKKALKIVIPLGIILVIVAACLGYRYFNRTIWNDTYVNGNIAGNLYNGGLFCERNGMVYFSNPNDRNRLYSMTAEGGDLKKLCDDMVSYINADDRYVYYTRINTGGEDDYSFLHINTNSLCRFDLKTGKITILDNAPAMYAVLIGNYVYYMHYDTEKASTFYRIKIDGTEKEMINKNPVIGCAADGQYLYYHGVESDHNIYRLDTNTNSSSLIYEGNCMNPILSETGLFFLDCDNNYAPAKLNPETGEKTLLTEDRVDCFNLYGNYLYYQKNDGENPAFCRIKTDGSGYEVIQQGNFTNINITSSYVYFSPFSNQDTIFQLPVNGSAEVTAFSPESLTEES